MTVDMNQGAALEGPGIESIEVHGVTRSHFLLRSALTAGAVMGAGAVGPMVSSAFAATAASDLDILNFALTLEYLEADFYTVKGKQVGLTGAAKALARSFGAEETAHVDALTAAIKSGGGKPVAKPKFVFPVTNQAGFLKLAYTLENVGVGAYNGAGPSLKDKALLAAAGSIVQIEARHAAAIGLMVNESVVPNGGFDKPLTKAQVLKAAGPLIKG
jgi:hypothetical protein